MPPKKISLFRFRLVGLIHWIMWNFKIPKIDHIFVSEFPKSGGTWFCKMLEDITGITQPDNYRVPKFTRSILHGHQPYKKKFENVICIVRDGRDVMVSAYYFFLLKNDRNLDYGVNKYRNLLNFDDYEDIRANMPKFIEFMFTNFKINRKRTNWSGFYEPYLENPNVLLIKYEDLLTDAVKELRRTLNFMNFENRTTQEIASTTEKFTFEKMSKRKRGEEDTRSFLRKGIAGDWKNKFTTEACETFDKYAGDMLIRLGYEEDHEWY